MILCLCRGVTDREVREAVERGADTAAEVRRRCGAGSDCGSCVGEIEAHLRAAGAGRCPQAA